MLDLPHLRTFADEQPLPIVTNQVCQPRQTANRAEVDGLFDLARDIGSGVEELLHAQVGEPHGVGQLRGGVTNEHRSISRDPPNLLQQRGRTPIRDRKIQHHRVVGVMPKGFQSLFGQAKIGRPSGWWIRFPRLP